MQSTHEIYATEAFGGWHTYTNLEVHEGFLAKSQLDPAKRTLEAGTGGGRIVLALRDLGFRDLFAYDFVPGFVDEVRQADPARVIRLSAQDATRLAFADASFDQILYLAQIVSLIDIENGRSNAIREAHRILKPGGVAMFSFLSHEVRSGSRFYKAFLTWLRAYRFLTRSRRSLQQLPWLKFGSKFNYGALLDRRPYVYWYRAEEVVAELVTAGFKVNAVASLRQLREGRLISTTEELKREPMTGHFYCVCTK